MPVYIKCPNCGQDNVYDDACSEYKCGSCRSILPYGLTLLDKNLSERLGIAAGFRRVGNFEDSQKELEILLEKNPDMSEALFGCVLNYYEVTEFAFSSDNINIDDCKCYSTDRRPIDKNKYWEELVSKSKGKHLRQLLSLGDKIDELRKRNISIKKSIPRYRAILIYDYSNQNDALIANGLYDILSKKTDIFFPPVSLKNVPYNEREKYLMQVLCNPEIAPIMFVLYSDSFNFRNKSANYYGNVARQCMDFSKVHTKNELISITCDYEPPTLIKRISIKTIECEDFDKASYSLIADAVMEHILNITYDDEEFLKYDEGEIIKLNGNVLSPLVQPLK